MNQLEAIKLNKAINLLNDTIELIDGTDREYLQDMVKEYSEKLASFEGANIQALNPTKTELGMVKSVYKKVVLRYFLGDIWQKHNTKAPQMPPTTCDKCEDSDYACEECDKRYSEYLDKDLEHREEISDLEYAFEDQCDKYNLSDKVVSAKILFSRKIHWGKVSPMERELNDHIKLLMIEEFQNNNQQFITKTLRNYATR